MCHEYGRMWLWKTERATKQRNAPTDTRAAEAAIRQDDKAEPAVEDKVGEKELVPAE